MCCAARVCGVCTPMMPAVASASIVRWPRAEQRVRARACGAGPKSEKSLGPKTTGTIFFRPPGPADPIADRRAADRISRSRETRRSLDSQVIIHQHDTSSRAHHHDSHRTAYSLHSKHDTWHNTHEERRDCIPLTRMPCRAQGIHEGCTHPLDTAHGARGYTRTAAECAA